ncbi:ferritin-like domain-containing protein [Roseisolibacter sp. H3M3-2]|uniref:YciE/YciF ferroxidase family protein n=1 Tax=Roseisolibacter sp. H3M3-2 TaxID=3031323 RepID=UPI0023DA9757|nr:ferritin-like domain-containing protein [Roseisolibacter sp. H3M3-2]MDF1504682.1 ferritin-like domain-containing protein [Roseisolibacter sp. H3M3-2]
MAVEDLQDLLKHELGDLLYAEKTILKGLKKMTREVSNPDMKQRLEAHYGETEQQIENLERAFESLGLKARAQKCPGILGIMQEHEEFKSEEEPSKPILEAFDLGAGLRVEHYEIAGYRSAIALARALRAREVVDLLKQNLEQEVAMAKFIETSAAASLQQVQGMLAGQENGNGGARKSAGKSAGKTASRSASKSAAKTASKGAAKRGGARSAAASGGDMDDVEVEQGRDD